MYYYRRIRELREDNDLLQKQIAEVLGITREQYQLYESGKREIKLNQAIELAKFYKVSLDYMVGLSNDPTPKVEQKSIKKKQVNNISGGKNINITQN